jgi:hypothetical protein
MRRLFSALALCLVLPAAPLKAADISAEIAANGIAATRERLAALAAPSDEERFALGGLIFLGAVEAALQLRYRVQLSPDLDLPVLRLPVPPNPAPEAFRAEMLGDLLAGLVSGMDEAAKALAAIPETSDFALAVRPADLWFNIDGDGRRGKGESFLEVAGGVLFGRTGFESAGFDRLEIRFDVADSRWLAAYAELIRGTALVFETYDVTAAVDRVLTANADLWKLNRGTEMANALDMMVGGWVDSAATVLWAMRSDPDPTLAAEALDAAERMIGFNRDFWRLVAVETDDDAEWIPSDRQHSALGMTFPDGTSTAWLEVLDDADRLLKGKLLLPYWRLGEARGLNLRKMFLEPAPIDIVGWVQGAAALPYVETGPRITWASLHRFDRLVEGQGMMFAVLLN